jgi:type VI secretion system protein ImpK
MSALSGEPALALQAPIQDPDPDPGSPGAPDPARLIDALLELIVYTCSFLDPGAAAARPPFARVAEHYELLLQRAAAFKDAHGFPERDWEEALFAVCAWVDEKILCSDWEGRAPWVPCQLQRRRFATTRAGEQFYQRLEALPEGAGQVLEVYAYCLALGFQGRFFGPDDVEARRELRAGLQGRLPASLRRPQPAELFPEAGRSSPPERRRPRVALPVLLAALLFLVPPGVFFLAHWSFARILDGLLHNLLP